MSAGCHVGAWNCRGIGGIEVCISANSAAASFELRIPDIGVACQMSKPDLISKMVQLTEGVADLVSYP